MTISSYSQAHGALNWDLPINAKFNQLIDWANNQSYATKVTVADGGTYSMTGDEYLVIITNSVAGYTIEFPENPEDGQFVRLMFFGAIPSLTITHDVDDITPDLTSTPSGVSSYAWVFDAAGSGTWVGITNPVPEASTTDEGVTRFATRAEGAARALSTVAVTPDSMDAALDALINDATIATGTTWSSFRTVEVLGASGNPAATVVTPTNGGTYNITGLESSIVFNNAATVATYTIVFPAAPAQGLKVKMFFAGSITALTITHSAALMFPQPTTISGSTTPLYEWTLANLSGTGDVWYGGLQPATTSAGGYAEAATSAETITGTDATRFVTPAGLTAKIDDLGWIAATLGNSWTNAVTVGYRKANGRVSLRGRATGGTTNTMFTLPAGYRPATALTIGVLSGASGSTMCTITISTGGAVAATSGTVPNLDGVEFFNS